MNTFFQIIDADDPYQLHDPAGTSGESIFTGSFHFIPVRCQILSSIRWQPLLTRGILKNISPDAAFLQQTAEKADRGDRAQFPEGKMPDY